MFDVIARRVDHARHQYLVVRERDIAKHRPLVFVPRIGAFQKQVGRLCAQYDTGDRGKRNIPMMRARVVSPTDVQPHPVGRNPVDGEIQSLDVALGEPNKFGIRKLCKGQMAAHRQIRTVDLQQEPCLDDGLVFFPHRLGNCLDVLVLARVVLVLLEYRNDAWRGGIHERAHRAIACHRMPKVIEVPTQRAHVSHRDGSTAV